MAKKSKEKKKKRLRKNKRREFYQEQIALTLEKASKLKKELIPSRATIDPRLKELIDDDERHFILNFHYYSSKECQLCRINDIQARSLIERLKEINSRGPHNISSSNIIRGEVYNDGLYKSLFVGLPPDREKIKESYLPGGGRMYFFIVEEYFCIVAIQARHKNIK